MARQASDMYNDDQYFDDRDSQGADGDSFSDQIDLQHYLRILRKFKWPITFFTTAVTALAAYYAFTATPIYRSTSTLLIEQQQVNPVSIEDLLGTEVQNQDYYQTQFELLKSRALAVRVVDKLELWDHPELSSSARAAAAQLSAARRNAIGEERTGVMGSIDKLLSSVGLGDDTASATDAQSVSQENSAVVVETQIAPTIAGTGETEVAYGQTPEERHREEVIGRFMANLTVAPVRKTKLVKLSYESEDPILAAQVANVVGEEYIKSYLDARLEMTQQAQTWLSERLTSLKNILDESEDRLIAYKQENGLVDVDGSVGRLNEQELFLVTTELAQARTELSGVSDLYREVQSLRGSPQLLETIPAIQADPLVQRVKIEQGQAQRQLDELGNRYGERHPRVVDAKSQLASLETTLGGHITRKVSSIEKDYQLARQKVGAAEAKLASGKREIEAIGTKTFELAALEREVATNQDIYDQYFNRMTEANSADGLETANARISDFAVAPRGAVKPKKQLIIALAGLASLVLSMLMAFLYEQMDDTIKGTNDIESKLGLKMLGILPLVKSGMFSGGDSGSGPLNPLVVKDKKGTFAEAVNTARTALCMGDGDEGRKVIMITSSVPGEGKSTASLNIAYSLSQLERVLLIDCDMRRPTIAKAAGLEKNAPGLSNLITGKAPPTACIHRGCFEGAIDVIPSGPIPDQPLELLSSKRFEKIVQELSKHYDRIVFDCAPTQAVSDALVLSKLSDAVIYAVKSHDTSMELVKRGIQRLKQVNAPIAGVLITQVDINKIVSYGGDYYYQGYYDYYGYNEKGSKSEKGKGNGKIRLTQEELQAIRTDDREVDLNMGLDFSNAEPHRNGADIQADISDFARTNGATGKRRVADNPGAFASDEMDLTVQLDANNGAVAPTRVKRSQAKRFSDDLDII